MDVNMKNMTLVNIAQACGGILHEPAEKMIKTDLKEASCVVIDSRKIEPGGVFIATKGEKVDGHTFIPSVIDKGAIGIVCEREIENCTVPYILVEDSFKALKDIAEFYRKQL